jgi:hypothetical protein
VRTPPSLPNRNVGGGISLSNHFFYSERHGITKTNNIIVKLSSKTTDSYLAAAVPCSDYPLSQPLLLPLPYYLPYYPPFNSPLPPPHYPPPYGRVD